jgi:hypothetical protein
MTEPPFEEVLASGDAKLWNGRAPRGSVISGEGEL